MMKHFMSIEYGSKKKRITTFISSSQTKWKHKWYGMRLRCKCKDSACFPTKAKAMKTATPHCFSLLQHHCMNKCSSLIHDKEVCLTLPTPLPPDLPPPPPSSTSSLLSSSPLWTCSSMWNNDK